MSIMPRGCQPTDQTPTDSLITSINPMCGDSAAKAARQACVPHATHACLHAHARCLPHTRCARRRIAVALAVCLYLLRHNLLYLQHAYRTCYRYRAR